MIKSLTTNLMVENVDETIAFYLDVLDFTVITSVPSKQGGLQFAMIMKDNFVLMLQQRSSFIEEYPIMDRVVVNPSISLFIEIEDIDFLYKTIKEKCAIYKDLNTTFYGTKEFAIVDNNGYVLTFSKKVE